MRFQSWQRCVSGVMLVLVIATIVVFTDDHLRADLFGGDGFSLEQISFADASENKVSIPQGYTGYIVFYGTYSDCSSCMRRLKFLSQLAAAYEEVGFFAVLRGHLQARDFFNQMVAYEVPGTYLIDETQVLQHNLSLSNHPKLLLFDRSQRLIAVIPMNIENDGLLKDLHRLIGEM